MLHFHQTGVQWHAPFFARNSSVGRNPPKFLPLALTNLHTLEGKKVTRYHVNRDRFFCVIVMYSRLCLYERLVPEKMPIGLEAFLEP
jgi:hypothetical protein